MKDTVPGGTWRLFFLTALLYACLSVAPALLFVKYVLNLDNSILLAVLVGQAFSFIILRRTLSASAERMLRAVCGLIRSNSGEIKGVEDRNPGEVVIDKDEVYQLSALMFWLSAMIVVMVRFSLSWEVDLRLSFGGLFKFAGYLIVVYVFHEALHGIAAMAWAKIPFQSLHFGFNRRLIALYCHADRPMAVSAYRAFVLLPIIVTAPAAALVLWSDPSIWSLLLFSGTVAGCAGDVMVYFQVRRLDNDRWVTDHPSDIGFRIFPEGETPGS